MTPGKRYRLAAALVGVALLINGTALAYVPGFADDFQAVNSQATGIRPLYLDQLADLKARKEKSLAPPPTHTVQRGETLSLLARKYGLTVPELVMLNNLSNADLIKEGQVLVVAAAARAAGPPELVHTLKRGETVWDLSRAYQVGTGIILAANRIEDPTRLQPGQKLIIPGGQLPAVSRHTPVARESVSVSRAAPRAMPDFYWPFTGRITSGFGPRWGRFHYGVDIAGKHGSPIVAVAAGTVVEAGWRGSYGYMVRIDHHNGWESLYAHASRLSVSSGDQVSAGQVIASIGQTGNATGPHVHLELIYQGQHQNPVKYLPKK